MSLTGNSTEYYADVWLRRQPDRLVLRYFPMWLGVLVALVLLFALGSGLSGARPGIAGSVIPITALIALLLVELRTCTFDRAVGTITFRRWGLRKRMCDERPLADLLAVGVKVVDHGGCYVTLHFGSGEPVRLFGEPLGADGAKVAAEIHDFLKLETPVRVES